MKSIEKLEALAPESPVEVSRKVLMEVSTNQPLSELQCPCLGTALPEV